MKTAQATRAIRTTRRVPRTSVSDRRGCIRSPRLGIERLDERLLLSTTPLDSPQAAEPPIVQAAIPVLDEQSPSTSAGAITFDEPRQVKLFRVRGEGRLIVDMRATDGALDSMLWLYDAATGELLVNNDDRTCDDVPDEAGTIQPCDPRAAQINQYLAAGIYRLEMSASLAAIGNGAAGVYTLDVQWQPTAELSVASIRVEGGKEGAAIADLDGDGHLDIAAVNDDNRLTVAYGTGDGSFRDEVLIAELQAGASRRIVAGNFDNAGNLDLAITLVTERQLLLVTNGENGKWDTSRIKTPISLDGAPDAMAVGDLNGDRIDDLLVPTHDLNQWIFYGDAEKPFVARDNHRLVNEQGATVVDGRAAMIGDFNGDSRLDFAVAVKNSRVVHVLLNTGNDPQSKLATFAQSDIVPMGPPTVKNAGTEGLAVGDFNGDGKLDLAAVNDKSDTVSIRLGSGDGKFAHTGGDFKVGVDSEVVRVADFNGDRIDDLVVTNEDTHNVSVLIGVRDSNGKGTGEFHPRQLYACGFRPTDLGIGDLNGDGNVDVAVKIDGGGLTFLFGLGDGTFLVPESTALGDDPDAIVAADFNADGSLDVAVANLLSHEVSVLLGRGDGGFSPQTRYQLEQGSYPHAIAVADLNNDGRPDLITANEGTDDVAVLLGLGNGQFRPLGMTFPVGDSPWSIVVEDFDGDKRLDFATANRKDNSVTVWYGKASTELAFERERDAETQEEIEGYSVGSGMLPEMLVLGRDDRGDSYLATVNRLSHDFTVFAFTPSVRGFGEPDVRKTLPGTHSFHPSDLPGWAESDRALPRPEVNGSPDVSPTRFMPRMVTTADVNNDGRTDAVMIDDRTHSAWILLGHGDGAFAPPIQFPISFDPECVVAEDLDADGNVDLVIGHDTDNLVILYYGRGDGTFDDGVVFEVDDGPERVFVEDFNNDGSFDFAVANDDAKTLMLFMQRAGREFVQVDTPIAKSIDAADGELPKFNNGATAGRFVRDGRLDLAAFDRTLTDATVHIFAGRTDDRFELAQSVELAPTAKGITPKAEFLVAADLDNDGDDDIVVPEMTANRVWILWNDDGVFTAVERDFGGPNPSGAADLDVRPAVVGDLNGDGYLDIATVDKLVNQVRIMYGDANSKVDHNRAFALEHADTVRVGMHPGTLAIDRINDDDRLDLIVGNRGSYDLSILLGSAAGGFQSEARVGRTSAAAPSVIDDFNLDTYPDRITLRDIDNDLSIELGRSDGEFDATVNGARRAIVNPLVVDLNGDGGDDIVNLNYRGEILVRFREKSPVDDESSLRYAPPIVVNHVSLGGEKPSLYPARDIALAKTPLGWQIVSADLKDDRGQPGGQTGVVSLYRLEGEQFARTTLHTAGGAANVAAGDLDGDFDGDNLYDLVVYSAFAGQASVFQQSSNGAFTIVGDPIDLGKSVADLSLVDVVGGKNSGDDLVVTSRTAGAIRVYVGNGNATFKPRPQIAAHAGDEKNWPYGYHPHSGGVVSVHDTATISSGWIDGDDSPDFVAINPGTNSATLLLGKQQQTLLAPWPIELDGTPAAVVIGDVNNDRHADLVVLYASIGEAAVLLGDGERGFQPFRKNGAEVRPRVGGDPVGAQLADSDRDGNLDLVVSNRFGDVLTLLGNGDGTFREYRRAEVNVFLTVEDIDRDGRGDYIFTNESQDRIEVRSSSTNGFTQDASHGLLAPGKVAVADLNQDGIVDLAVPNYGANTVIVYVGISPGVFAPGRSYPVGGNPAHVTTADINRDDAPDLVVANSGSNDVVVMFGQGRAESWQLSLGPRLATGQGPVHTQIADATGPRNLPDGVLDIVVTNQRDNSVVILPGRGGGFFDDRGDSVMTFAVGSRPVQSFVSGSGLVTINSGSNTLTFFPAMNPNTFTSTSTFGARPVAAVMGDFDFDRRTELIVAHELDGVFSVFAVDASGFTLLRSQRFAGLDHPTDMAVWNDHGRISVFGVGGGVEAAYLLFSAVPDVAFDLVRASAAAPRSEFSQFGDSFLPFILGLVAGEATTLGILFVPRDENDVDLFSIADDVGIAADSPSDRVPVEWIEEFWPDEEDSSDAPHTAETSEIVQAPPILSEEAIASRLASVHDMFFEFGDGDASEVLEGSTAAKPTIIVVEGDRNEGDSVVVGAPQTPDAPSKVEPTATREGAVVPIIDPRPTKATLPRGTRGIDQRHQSGAKRGAGPNHAQSVVAGLFFFNLMVVRSVRNREKRDIDVLYASRSETNLSNR